MNKGPLLFLYALFTIMLSIGGLIVAPMVQIGDLQPISDETTGNRYPGQPVGLAQRGAGVYAQNGCQYCHTQQIRQEGFHFDIYMEDPGTNTQAVAEAIMETFPAMVTTEEEAEFYMFADSELIKGIQYPRMDAIRNNFEESGASLRVEFIPTGPDIERGWGARTSVAHDYLYSDPLLIGDLRLGPDLSTVGSRLPDAQWHYQHLYRPRSVVEGSTMPAYEFLFTKQPIDGDPSPEALDLTGEFAPEEGYEIVPTEEARALVAYLQSLRTPQSLPIAPMNTANAE